jgi:SSS family solute:Na+ symporter
MNLTNWALVLAFSALMVSLGLASHLLERRRGADAEGFWTAHRSLPGWTLGLSLSASMLSVSWSLVYGVELFYRYGWGGLWLLGIPWLVVLALFFLFAPTFRAFAAFSQGELFSKVYGLAGQVLAVLVISLVFLAWCGAEIAAAAQALAPAVSLPTPWIMAGIALLVASYTWAGGFRAVILTDVAQFALIALFFLYLGGTLLSQRQGFATLASASGPSPSLVGTTLLVYITGWLAEADIWLRLTAARDTRHARLAMALTFAISLVLVVAFPALLAAAARAHFPQPEKLAQPALLALLPKVLPAGGHLLVVGGLLAVALSTVSTTANVVAVTWARDWPGKSPWKDNLAFARWVSALATFAAMAVALASRSLAELFYLSGGLLSAGLFWPTIGLLLPKFRPAAAFAGWFGLFAVTLTFTLERSGLWSFSTDPGVQELGVGYILPALAAGAAAFVLHLLLGLGKGSCAPPAR